MSFPDPPRTGQLAKNTVEACCSGRRRLRALCGGCTGGGTATSRCQSRGSTARPPPRVGIVASSRPRAVVQGGKGLRDVQVVTTEVAEAEVEAAAAAGGAPLHIGARLTEEEEEEEEGEGGQAVVGSFRRWTRNLRPQTHGSPPAQRVRDGQAMGSTASSGTTRPASTGAQVACGP